ncbi:MAG TPA: hypothetical protein VJQ25_10945 [Nitrospira sp.]|nr:hypothetical protein [Nitrospira sp.]
MEENVKSILTSRTVWTAIAGAVVAIAGALGYPIADSQINSIIDLILFVMAGFFRVSATKQISIGGK